MGGCSSTEGYKRNQAIEKDLQKTRQKLNKLINSLLLGPGESGKSTVFKQMKIMQINGGFSKEELQSYAYIIFNNCISQMKVLVGAAQQLQISLDNQENVAKASQLLALPGTGTTWTEQIGNMIKSLWGDTGIKQTYDFKDRYFQLNDTADYFFESIDRFIQPDYIPSTEDVLRARVRSTGIEEAEFKFEDMAFKMVDVGGQRSERRKWIHCFDNVTAVIFVAALSEYDQMLREEESQNRMHESIYLFEEIANSPAFNNINIILFLNKTDLFKDKIKRVDLSVCFDTFTGGSDYDTAAEFVRASFIERNTSKRDIYTHFTCAINTDNMNFVFQAVRKTLLDTCLKDTFLM